MKQAIVVALLGILLISASRRPKPVPYQFPELQFFPPMPRSDSNAVTEEGVRLGRFLFYDPVLSADSDMACGSCHRQQSAFSDGPNRFSNGRLGSTMRRNTPPLFNLAWYPAFFWDGRAATLEGQVLHPVRAHDEMNMLWPVVAMRLRRNPFYAGLFRSAFGDEAIDSVSIAKAIAQFERTLLSYRSKYDRVLAGQDKFTDEEYDGFDIMNDMSKGDCLHCHATDDNALGVIPSFSNNGLDLVAKPEDYKDAGLGKITGKMNDNGRFKVPSLRNIALTAPYMHDGRFTTLAQVLDFYSEGVHAGTNVDPKMEFAGRGGVHLSEPDKRKVIAFLQTLTDSAFISDPAFSSPFIEKTGRRQAKAGTE